MEATLAVANKEDKPTAWSPRSVEMIQFGKLLSSLVFYSSSLLFLQLSSAIN
jgi:hypothetical protein